jgi:ABC-type proline/glycine betaine transport system permease subunit
MTLGMMIVISVPIGWLAHSWKKRTGALWGFISFLLMIPTWVVLYFGTSIVNPALYQMDAGWYALGIMVSLGIGVIMALILATLPQK